MVNGSVTNWAMVCPTWARRRHEQGREKGPFGPIRNVKEQILVAPTVSQQRHLERWARSALPTLRSSQWRASAFPRHDHARV